MTSAGNTLGTISWPTDTAEINKYSIGNKAPGYNTGANGILDSGSKIANLSVSYTAAPAAPSVPEPATATLSLLALAGLAARRRRK